MERHLLVNLAEMQVIASSFFTCRRLKEKDRIEYLYSLSNCAWKLLDLASLSNQQRLPSHRPDV
jgi:uncharacterized ferredoxin-like protein